MTGAILSYNKENVSDIAKTIGRGIERFSLNLSKLTGIDFTQVMLDYSDEINGFIGYLLARRGELQAIGLNKKEIIAFLTLNMVSFFSLWHGFKRAQVQLESSDEGKCSAMKERISFRRLCYESKTDYKSGVVIPTNLEAMGEDKLHQLVALVKSLTLWENLSCVWIVGKIPKHASKMLSSIEKTKIISLEQDMGPARSRNIGIDMALESDTDLLVFMDDDVINPISTKFKKVCNLVVTTTDIYFPRIKAFGNTCFDCFHDLDGTLNGVYEPNSELTRLVYGTTCVMIAPTVVFESGVRFDENFPLAGGEDIDFCMRIKANGHKLIPVDDLVVLHDYGYEKPGESLRKFVSRFVRYGEGNRLIKERQPEYFSIITSALRRPTKVSKRENLEIPELIERLSIILQGYFE